MELRFAISLEEFVEASALWAKGAKRKRQTSLFESWRGFVYLAFLLVAGLLISQTRGKYFIWIMISLAGIWGVSIIFARLICPRAFRSTYEQQKPGMNVRMVIGEAGIESECRGRDIRHFRHLSEPASIPDYSEASYDI
jgi:hypothetical protein